MAPLEFMSNPRRYMLWAAREKPAIFWSIIVGSFGPIMMIAVPPIRARLGDGPRPLIPQTYPSTSFQQGLEDLVPPGPRKIPQGYDD